MARTAIPSQTQQTEPTAVTRKLLMNDKCLLNDPMQDYFLCGVEAVYELNPYLQSTYTEGSCARNSTNTRRN
jgi:hypothetical protein